MTEDAEPPIRRRRAPIAALLVLTLAVLAYAAVQAWPRGPSRTVEAFCAQLGAVQDFDRALGDLDVAAVEDTLPRLEQLRAVSPPEIEAQVGVVVDVSQSLAGAVDQAAVDDGRAVQEAWRARAGDLPRITAAGRTVQDYARTNCNVDLAPVGSSSVPQTSTSVGGPSTTLTPH